jgi:hypothetical protein
MMREEGNRCAIWVKSEKNIPEHPNTRTPNTEHRHFHSSRLIRAGLLVAIAASSTGSLFAANQPTGPAIELNLKFRVGETSRYRMAVQVEAKLPPMGTQPSVPVYNVAVDLVEQEKVVRALPNGGGEIAISTLSGQGTSNGTPFTPATDKKPALIGFNAHGDLLSVKDLPAGNAGVPLLSNMFGSGALSMNGVFLPNSPVRVGETWSKKVHIAGLTGDSQATVKATLIGTEEVGHYKTAKIHAVLTAPLHTLIDASYQPTQQARAAVSTLTGTFHMIYDTNLAIAEGKVVRAAGHGEVTVLIQPNSGPTQTAAPTQTKPTANGKGKPATPNAVKPTAAAPAPNRMVLRLNMGNNLME